MTVFQDMVVNGPFCVCPSEDERSNSTAMNAANQLSELIDVDTWACPAGMLRQGDCERLEGTLNLLFTWGLQTMAVGVTIS